MPAKLDRAKRQQMDKKPLASKLRHNGYVISSEKFAKANSQIVSLQPSGNLAELSLRPILAVSRDSRVGE